MIPIKWRMFWHGQFLTWLPIPVVPKHMFKGILFFYSRLLNFEGQTRVYFVILRPILVFSMCFQDILIFCPTELSGVAFCGKD